MELLAFGTERLRTEVPGISPLLLSTITKLKHRLQTAAHSKLILSKVKVSFPERCWATLATLHLSRCALRLNAIGLNVMVICRSILVIS